MIETKPGNFTYSSIANLAQKVGEKYQAYSDEGLLDHMKLLEAIGGRIEYAHGPESSEVAADGTFTIYLPHFTSPARDRFTIAHEIGHYYLHYKAAKPEKGVAVSFGRSSGNRAETEANVFASALLMPEKAFKRVWKRNNGDAHIVSRHFDVSPAAAGVRAEVLQLVD